MDCIIHGVAKSQTWLSDFHFHLGLTSLVSLLSKRLSRVFSSTTFGKHQFFGTQPSLWSNSHICTWLLDKIWLWFYGPNTYVESEKNDVGNEMNWEIRIDICILLILCIKYPELPKWHSVKELVCQTGELGLIPGSEYPLEEKIATHSNNLAWKIPWTKKPGRLVCGVAKSLTRLSN